MVEEKNKNEKKEERSKPNAEKTWGKTVLVGENEYGPVLLYNLKIK